MNANPTAMKTFLFVLIAAVSIRLDAQSSSVSVDIQYRIDPRDTSVMESPFFLARLNDPIALDLKTTLLEITANRILQGVTVNGSVPVYNSFYDLQLFSTSTSIGNCGNIKPEYFRIAGNSPQELMMNRGANDFKKNGKVAVADNMMVMQDKKIVYSVDSIMVERKGKYFPQVIYNYLKPETISPFFIENWNFDPTNGHFEKNIKYYGYFHPVFSSDGALLARAMTFGIDNDKHSSANATNVLIKKNMICDVAIHRPEQMLGSDTTVEKLSGMDAISYLNILDGNIPEVDRAKFLSALFYFALNNPKNVFPENSSVVDSLHPFTSADQIQALFSHYDTLQIEDVDPGTFSMTIIKTETPLSNVYALRFYEDWYYDPTDFTIKKVVRGIGILLMETTDFGEPWIKDAGIYIKMN